MAAITDGRSNTLSKWHLIAGSLHLLNFAILLAVATHRDVIGVGVETYTTRSFNATGDAQYEVALEKTGRSVYPIVLVLVFFAVTSVFHFIYSFDSRETGMAGGKSVFNYGKQLMSGVVWARWVEYSITASLMQVIFVVYSGVPLESTIVCVVGLTVCLMAFGAWSEMEETKSAALWVYMVGLVAWVATLVVTFSGLHNADPPAWVSAVVVLVQLVLFGGFGAVRLVSILVGESPARYKSEYAYITLSLLSKTILGWVLAGRL